MIAKARQIEERRIWDFRARAPPPLARRAARTSGACWQAGGFITRISKTTSMSDNEYGDGDGGEEYDVFANEDDDPQVDEAAPLEADPADMEVVDAGDAGGAGLRSADDRITTKYMTKYERARILGTRALQIRCGVRFGEGTSHRRVDGSSEFPPPCAAVYQCRALQVALPRAKLYTYWSA